MYLLHPSWDSSSTVHHTNRNQLAAEGRDKHGVYLNGIFLREKLFSHCQVGVIALGDRIRTMPGVTEIIITIIVRDIFYFYNQWLRL